MRFKIAEHDGKAFIVEGDLCHGPIYPDKAIQVWLAVYAAGVIRLNRYTRHTLATMTLWGDRDYLDRIPPGLDLSALGTDNPLPGVFTRWVRQSKKMTLVQFAASCGVTEPTVVNWEQGHTPCTGSGRLIVLSHMS